MHKLSFASVLMMSLAVGCSDRAGSADSGEPGGTMVVVTPGTGTSPMFPPYAADGIARMVADNVYERLAEIGPDLNTFGDKGFQPRLARSWEWAADSMSIAFRIDPRARWHDGRPVSATDVRFSFNLLKDPATATPYTAMLAAIDSIAVRDSLTAVAWFARRTPEQFYDVTYQMFILPEHILKDIPRDKLATSEVISRPVGTGRFRFASFEPGVRVELVADTANYRGRAKLDRVIVAFASDGSAAVAQLLNGQADYMDIVPSDVIARIDSSGNVRAMPYPGLGYAFLGMNQRDPKRLSASHPVLGDLRVRRAISMALDRQSMLRNVFDTLGTLNTGPFPRAIADTTVTLPPFDRAGAAALLDSAGWRAGADGIRVKGGRPLAFGIVVPTSSRARMRYAVLIQEQLKGIGARASIDAMDFGAFLDRQEKGQFDAAMMSHNTDPTPSTHRQYWLTASIPPGGSNYPRYSNRTVDALLDSALTTFDRQRSKDQLHRAMQLLVDDAPAVWLYDVLTVAGSHKRIRREGVRADGWWSGLADWWIPANERIDRDRIGLRPAQP